MDHREAIRAMAAEKYLLEELAAEARDQFEEHFFSCQDCATDVRAGLAFLEHTKVELAEAPATQPVVVVERQKAGWLAWLRPPIAASALALLLAVIGYQQFVTIAKSKSPRILAATYLTLDTRGDDVKTVSAAAGQPMTLEFASFGDSRFASYSVELLSPANQLVWSGPIGSQDAKGDSVVVAIPGGVKDSGTYTVQINGIDANGKTQKIGSNRFKTSF